MFRSSPTGSKSSVLRRYYVASYRPHVPTRPVRVQRSCNGHRPVATPCESSHTGCPLQPRDYSKATLTHIGGAMTVLVEDPLIAGMVIQRTLPLHESSRRLRELYPEC